ncbi:hypothetical protein WJX72_009392 [[Myrmecia] bisecta]|uniref:DUF3445 domain-containing protein n=1 Tax=[Myrmecia] bisecta TaxID=41462 RepID=A0AAW1P542_9CHLO
MNPRWQSLRCPGSALCSAKAPPDRSHPARHFTSTDAVKRRPLLPCPRACPLRNVSGFLTKPQHKVSEYNYTKQMKTGPYKMTMGLEPMNPRDWMEVDAFYQEEMALRQQILAEKRDVVLAAHPGSEAACLEMLQLLAKYLPQQYPELFTLDGHTLYAHAAGEQFDVRDPGIDPLEACARLVQEDLCIMQEVDGQVTFTAGAVLFPQRWSLLEKMGMDMHRIHDPVPLYQTEVSRPVDGFMTRIKAGKPFWRANWAITDHPELFQPLVEEDIRGMTAGKLRDAYQPVTAENAGETLFTRCERETLSRFPETQAVLFTIRTYVRPLAAYAVHAQECAQLAEALRKLPDELVRYKTMAHIKAPAQEYLDNAVRHHLEASGLASPAGAMLNSAVVSPRKLNRQTAAV